MSRSIFTLLILYGTQTGSSQEVAERIGRDSRRHHFKTKVLSMDQYDPINLPLEKLVVFVASTTGQGDVPDNMKSFWKFMLRKNLQSDSLNNVKAAVIGLGDSSYPKFNFVGKKLFARLKSLGCNIIVRRGDCDDQHEFGIDYEVEKWSQELWKAVLEYYPMPPGLSVQNKDILSPPRFQINNATHTTIHQERETPPNTPPYTQNNPFYSKILCNTRITSPFAENDVRHIELDISSPGPVPSLIYNPGDVVYLRPHNPRDLALSFLHYLGLDPNFLVTSLHPNEEDTPLPLHTILPLPMTLLDIFVQYLDIQGCPRRYFFELLSFFATEEREKERLQHFASSEGQDDLQLYHYRERRTYLEIFRDFPSAKPPVEYIFDLIPPIHPRPFSISSSQKLHSNTIQISVSILKYTTPTKRQKIGVCSNWLSNLDPSDLKIPIFVKSSGAHLPNPIHSSVVMVGPGTGCAIFRAFMQERHVLLQQQQQQQQEPHESKNLQTIQSGEEEKVDHLDLNSKCMFFFGCRKESCDFLYRSEFESYLHAQTISDLVVAFSRDQPRKIYVQNKLEEYGKSVWDLITNGGYFCVSGSAKKMPQDVKNSLLNVIEKYGNNMNREAAEEYVRDMELKNRYVCETWY